MRRNQWIVAFLVVGLTLTLLVTGPANASLVASKFTGGDPGEGLDLQGNFLYALNFRNSNTSDLPIGDATFKAVTASIKPTGVTSATAIAWFDSYGVSYTLGASTNDVNLDSVMNSAAQADTALAGPLDVIMTVTPGKTYKLQILLFGSTSTFHRAGIYTVNGDITNYDIGLNDTPSYPTNGYVLTGTFVALTSTMEVKVAWDSSQGGNTPYTAGLTLETLPEPASLGLLTLGGLALLLPQRRR